MLVMHSSTQNNFATVIFLWNLVFEPSGIFKSPAYLHITADGAVRPSQRESCVITYLLCVLYIYSYGNWLSLSLVSWTCDPGFNLSSITQRKTVASVHTVGYCGRLFFAVVLRDQGKVRSLVGQSNWCLCVGLRGRLQREHVTIHPWSPTLLHDANVSRHAGK